MVDALARALISLGHEVGVLAPKPRWPLKVRDESFPYAVSRHPRFYSTHRFIDWYQVFLRRLYRREGFDLLHCHGIYPPGYIAALCRQAVPVPVVLTSHEGGLGEKNVRLAKPSIRRRYVEALAQASAWVAVSQSIADEYRQLCPAARPIVRISNGVDIRRWTEPQPRPASLDDAIQPGNYVFYIGRLRRRKGADTLVNAFAQTPANDERCLVIAGDGEDGPELRAQAHALGLAGKCRFVGWVDGAAKAYLLQNALFTVIPSRLEEAFGLVALESFAAGRPVLASSVAGLKELVVQDETGMLFEPDSVPSLVEALNVMLSDAKRLERMGARARGRVEEYDWQNVARRHVDLYRSLLSTGSLDEFEVTTATASIAET